MIDRRDMTFANRNPVKWADGEDSEGRWEAYIYRNYNYWIKLDSDTPIDQQHVREQENIDFLIQTEFENELHDFLEEKYEEDFC